MRQTIVGLCPLWVKSRHLLVQNGMSALLPIATAKADMCPANGHVRSPRKQRLQSRFDNPAKNFWKFKLV